MAKSIYLPKGVMKNYNVIINWKNVYDQTSNSDIKLYGKKKGQGEDYTSGWLLDYEYIKNHYKLIAINLSRKKRNRCRSKSCSANKICCTI